MMPYVMRRVIGLVIYVAILILILFALLIFLGIVGLIVEILVILLTIIPERLRRFVLGEEKKPPITAVDFAREKQKLEENRAKLGIHLKDVENIYTGLKDYKPSTPMSHFNHNPWYNLMIEYDTSPIKELRGFEDAQKHLAKDLPQFLEEITQVESQAKDLNDKVEKCRKDLHSRVKTELSSLQYPKDGTEPNIITISDNYTNAPNTIYLSSIIRVLSGMWISGIIYGYAWQKKQGGEPNLDDIIKALEDLRFLPDPPPEKLVVDSTHIATVPSELRNEMLKVLDKLRKDRQILDELLKFADAKEQLESKAGELSKEIEKPISLLESGKYETTCDYCNDLVLKSG